MATRGKKSKDETAGVTELPDGPADATGLSPRQRRVLEYLRSSI